METLAGRYRLLEPLGSGGMSVVWRGYDEVLGRQVAVKVLAAEFATDAEFRSRIRREAQAAARLSDPHITNVYDYGEAEDGTPFVVMELVDGLSLAERLEQGPLPWESVVKIGAEVAGALAAAHARGLVHQDIKPANVMLSPSGAKVVDFGISAVAGEHGGSVVLGTPGYLAPEQHAGAPAAPPTDVYALGRLLSQALDPRAVPARVRALIEQSLSPDPAARPSSATMAARLAEAVAATPGAARSAGRAPAPPHLKRAMPRYGTPPLGAYGQRGTRIMPPPPPVPPRPRRPRRWPWVASALVLIFLACLAGASLIGKRQHGTQAAASGPGSTAATHHAPSPTPRSTTRPPTTRPPTTAPASPGCEVDYQVSDYHIGFQARLTLTNSGTADISSWTLTFDFPGGQKLGVGWGGVWKQRGNQITVRDILVNGAIQPGKSIDIGFVGTYNGKNDQPRQFSLNNVVCGVGAG